jgi:hypothetical protein
MLQPDISPPATIQPLTRILPAIALVVVGLSLVVLLFR